MTKAIDLFAEFATDAALESDGVWEAYANDVEFLIGRSGNKAYRKTLSKLYEKNKRLLESKGEAAEQKSEEIVVDTMAKTILLGWKGDFKFKGEPLPYSVDNAKVLLGLKDFRAWVQSKADDQSRFKAVKDEEDAGN